MCSWLLRIYNANPRCIFINSFVPIPCKPGNIRQANKLSPCLLYCTTPCVFINDFLRPFNSAVQNSRFAPLLSCVLCFFQRLAIPLILLRPLDVPRLLLCTDCFAVITALYLLALFFGIKRKEWGIKNPIRFLSGFSCVIVTGGVYRLRYRLCPR